MLGATVTQARTTKWPVLTARILEPLHSIGHDAHTAQKARPLLLVDLLVVPYAHCDGVLLTKVPATSTQYDALHLAGTKTQF